MNKHNSSMDPILLSVLSNRINGIIREMTNTLLKSARSAVINCARDFSCAICTSDGDLLAVAEGLPIHIFGSDMQARELKRIHPNLEEGDCYLHNDPYAGNTHAADHAFLVPVFFEGEHFFTAIAKAHQADCGNALPTTYMAAARDVYEEGALIFRAAKIQRNYEMVQDVVHMMERRIRVPNQWYGDFLAGIGAARVAERRLKELCTKYGRDVVRSFIKEWLNYSEQRMANAIAKMPEASFSSTGNHDSTSFLPEGIPLRVEVSVDPDERMVHIDLRSNIDNLECGYNQTEATATSAVLAGLLNCLDPDIPQNSGSFRRVRVHLRENCVTGIPKFPHSCSVATTNVSDRMVNLTGSAFAQLGDGYGLAEGSVGLGVGMSVLSGTDPRYGDAPFVNQLHLSVNGGPASPTADGWITYGIPVLAGLMYRDSVEIDELKHPIEIQRLALIPGTGGAGKFRGAPASVLEFSIKSEEMMVIYPGDGQEFAPKGVNGGQDGALAERWHFHSDGRKERLSNAATVKMRKGDVVRGQDCSGGGYGRPENRDPARVLADVLEGYETVDRARNVYRVIFDSENVTDTAKVDVEATKRARAD